MQHATMLLAWLDAHSGALTVIIAVVAALASAGGWLCTWNSHHVLKKQINVIHIQINSRMDQLIAAATAAGIVRGRSEQRADDDEGTP